MPASQAIHLQQISQDKPKRSPKATSSTQNASQSPSNDAFHKEDTPSVASSQATNVKTPLRLITSLSVRVRESGHNYYQIIVGLAALAIGFVSLIFYTVRSYKLTVWTAHNDLIQTCAGLAQAHPDKAPDAKCARLMEEGPQDPPYSRIRRHDLGIRYGGSPDEIRRQGEYSELYVDAWPVYYDFETDEDTLREALPYTKNSDNNNVFAALGIILPLLVFCGFFIRYMRHVSRKDGVFTSAVKSEVQVGSNGSTAGKYNLVSQSTMNSWQQASDMRHRGPKTIEKNHFESSEDLVSTEGDGEELNWVQTRFATAGGSSRDSSSDSDSASLAEQNLKLEVSYQPTESHRIPLTAEYDHVEEKFDIDGFVHWPRVSVRQRGPKLRVIRSLEAVQNFQLDSEDETEDAEDEWEWEDSPVERSRRIAEAFMKRVDKKKKYGVLDTGPSEANYVGRLRHYI